MLTFCHINKVGKTTSHKTAGSKRATKERFTFLYIKMTFENEYT